VQVKGGAGTAAPVTAATAVSIGIGAVCARGGGGGVCIRVAAERDRQQRRLCATVCVMKQKVSMMITLEHYVQTTIAK
jgi:hypothetical protein